MSFINHIILAAVLSHQNFHEKGMVGREGIFPWDILNSDFDNQIKGGGVGQHLENVIPYWTAWLHWINFVLVDRLWNLAWFSIRQQ